MEPPPTNLSDAAGPGFDAFISYRRSDGRQTAQWIRRELQNYRPPKSLRGRVAARLKIYLDTAYERGTSDFYEHSIKPALLASRFMVVVATPDAVQRASLTTDWIAREIDDFSQGRNARNVIVVRAAGGLMEPLPGSLAERFPNIEIINLKSVGRFWFLNPAVAARIGNEKLKLIAPLIGLPPGDMPLLRQEEERRQQSRLGLAAGALLSVLMAISALSVFALASRFRAEAALESSMFSTGRMIASVARELDAEGATTEIRRNLLNEGCDLVDKLRLEATTSPRQSDLVTCATARAEEFDRQGDQKSAEAVLDASLLETRQRYRAVVERDEAEALMQVQWAIIAHFERSKQPGEVGQRLDALLADSRRLYLAHTDADPDLRLQQIDVLDKRAQHLAVDGSPANRDQAIADWRAAAQLVSVVAPRQNDADRATSQQRQAQMLESAAEIYLSGKDGQASALPLLSEAVLIGEVLESSGKVTGKRSLEIAGLLITIAELEQSAGHSAGRDAAQAKLTARLQQLETATDLDTALQDKLVRLKAEFERWSGSLSAAAKN